MKQLHELRAQLQEHITDPVIRGVHLYPSGYSPPNILILKRKTVRSFNSSERVALYYSEKLQRYFSVPFTVGREEEQDDVVGVSESAKEDAAIKALIDKPARTEEEQKEYEHQKDLARFRQRNARSSRGGASAGPRKLSEENKLVKPEDEFLKRGGLEKDLDKNQPKKHAVGDEVRYRLGSERHLRVGKVQQVMPEHLIVKRDGSHYKVHKDTVVHNSRTGYTREELNEISIPVAKKAYHARQNLGIKAMNKGDYKTALPQFHKALKTQRLLSKKYERDDKGETVKEAVIQEDAISHLQKAQLGHIDKPLYHKDGSQTHTDPTTAKALLMVHKDLTTSNQKAFADCLETSSREFTRMKKFAWDQLHGVKS